MRTFSDETGKIPGQWEGWTKRAAPQLGVVWDFGTLVRHFLSFPVTSSPLSSVV